MKLPVLVNFFCKAFIFCGEGTPGCAQGLFMAQESLLLESGNVWDAGIKPGLASQKTSTLFTVVSLWFSKAFKKYFWFSFLSGFPEEIKSEILDKNLNVGPGR